MATSQVNYDDIDVVQRPQLLVEFDERFRNLKEHKHVFDQLKKIQCPVLAVGIVGKYRSGKSWVINRLAGRKSQGPGFGVGAGFSSTTKGIWIWCRPFPQKNIMILFMDTEGFGDAHQANTFVKDKNLCVLTMMLCDVLIYNVTGVFEQSALENLSFVTTIAERMSIQRYHNAFPELLVLLRDITSKQMNGHQVCGNEYLAECLKPVDGQSEHNKLRNAVNAVCQKQSCFTLPFPVKDNDLLECLEDIEDSRLAPRYLAEEDKLKHYIVETCVAKNLIPGLLFNGTVFTDLAAHFIKTMMKDSVPNIPTAVEMLTNQLNEQVMFEVLCEYKMLMKAEVTEIQTIEKLDDYHMRVKNIKLKKFRRKLLGNTPTATLINLEDLFERQIQNEYDKYKDVVRVNHLRKIQTEHIQDMKRQQEERKQETDKRIKLQKEEFERRKREQDKQMKRQQEQTRREMERQKREIEEEMIEIKRQEEIKARQREERIKSMSQRLHEEQERKREEEENAVVVGGLLALALANAFR